MDPALIGIGVEPDLLPLRRLLDQRERFGAAAPIGAASTFVVGNHLECWSQPSSMSRKAP